LAVTVTTVTAAASCSLERGLTSAVPTTLTTVAVVAAGALIRTLALTVGRSGGGGVCCVVVGVFAVLSQLGELYGCAS
jgi:hypothetical protein